VLDASRSSGSPTVFDVVVVQPLASVTVSEYVPAATADKSSVIASLLHK
jgi:hypothetical protein